MLMRFRRTQNIGLNWHPLIAVSCCLLSLAAICAGCDNGVVASSSSKGGKHTGVFLEKAEFDFGRIKEIDSPVAKIVIRNNGKMPVGLFQMELSCGCMTTDFQRSEVPPGGRYECEIRLSSPRIGPGRQGGKVITKPPLAGPLEFLVTYTVEPSTYLFPKAVSLGTLWTLTEEWPIEKTLIVNELEKPVDLLGPLQVEYRGDAHQAQTLQYVILDLKQLKQGTEIKLMIFPMEEVSGSFTDKIRIVAQTAQGELVYHLTVFGSLATDDIRPSDTRSVL